MQVNWQGVFPAATTQFHADFSVDYASTTSLLDRLLEAGVHGLIVLGTVGENCSLDAEEKRAVLKAALDVCNGRAPVLAGVAECTTAMAAQFAQDAEMLGADGLMVLPAMVYKSDPRETIEHYKTVARASGLPVMCYNNPVSYGVDITPTMFAELASEPTLVAIKESSENVRRITDLKNVVGVRYVLFGGVDDLMLESILLGVVGIVSGLVNAFPEEQLRLWNLARAGRYEEALEIYRWFTPALHLDTHVKLVQYIKLAASQCGFGAETVRPPRLALEGEERREVMEIIRTAMKNRPTVAQPAES